MLISYSKHDNDAADIISIDILYYAPQVASFYGWPVSTTHCIVGSMVGFGLIYGGTNAVFWSSLAKVASSWIFSPVIGAAVSFLVYKCIRRVCICFTALQKRISCHNFTPSIFKL